jgi:hypothetical protein
MLPLEPLPLWPLPCAELPWLPEEGELEVPLSCANIQLALSKSTATNFKHVFIFRSLLIAGSTFDAATEVTAEHWRSLAFLKALDPGCVHIESSRL